MTLGTLFICAAQKSDLIRLLTICFVNASAGIFAQLVSARAVVNMCEDGKINACDDGKKS
jgi:hypothetical protein